MKASFVDFIGDMREIEINQRHKNRLIEYYFLETTGSFIWI